ncbi:MAG: diaminopimelate epimerase [Planctomycetes bacterium]|nr:diaminopimelate epimerase [Planctomycetota bacterium]
MDGAGNDFVCLDAVGDPALGDRRDFGQLAVAMSNRQSGVGVGRHKRVGADGLILIQRPLAAGDRVVAMRYFNADGTESPVCGNGIRCVVKYAIDHDLVRGPHHGRRLIVGVGGRRIEATYGLAPGSGEVLSVTVDMGKPILELAEIPVDSALLGPPGPEGGERKQKQKQKQGPEPPFYRVELTPQTRIGLKAHSPIGPEPATFSAVFVSMGNPHAVIYTANVAAVDLARLGPPLETHPAFPDRMNIHFVQTAGADEAFIRSWERGSGETRACGSGACAVCVAGVITGRTGPALLAHLPGGDLEIRYDQRTDRVFMKGPAVEEFSGEWEVLRAATIGPHEP